MNRSCFRKLFLYALFIFILMLTFNAVIAKPHGESDNNKKNKDERERDDRDNEKDREKEKKRKKNRKKDKDDEQERIEPTNPGEKNEEKPVVSEPTPNNKSKILAFEGAEGFGAFAKGGRGGKLLKVNSIEDTNKPGTLRWAIAQKNPRIIQFTVSGVIQLQDDLIITEPYITIDGSSAPGIGITLKDGSLIINTNDVIVRHIRSRLGDEIALGKKSKGKRKKVPEDSISVDYGNNVIIDHCSASWSKDEVISVTHSQNVTVQKSFITEPLNNPKLNDGQEHAFGALVAKSNNVSYIKNLISYTKRRTPQMTAGENKEVINNFITHYVTATVLNLYDHTVTANYHVINNYYQYPLTNSSSEILITPDGDQHSSSITNINIYLSGNLRGPLNNKKIVDWKNLRSQFPKQTLDQVRSDKPLFNVNKMLTPVDIWPTESVAERVLQDSGATLPQRDNIDKRIIEQIKQGKGDIIDSQDQVKGYDWRSET